MSKDMPAKIALIGAGGASFGPVVTFEALRAEGLRGATLSLIDINAERLETVRAAAERMNRALGSPMRIETHTDTPRGIEGAGSIFLSVEVGRWSHWREDLEIPRRHGSKQDMAECGGPGGLFHALRTSKLVLEICSVIEKHNPGALLVNVTNPLSKVNLAISRATKLNCIGLCPELNLSLPRVALHLGVPLSKFRAEAWGINHFTWYNKLERADTGEDLYPALTRNIKMFPFLHGKLGRRCFKEFGLYPVSSDSHIGEYLPSGGPGTRSVLPQWFPYQEFSRVECEMRVRLTEWYAQEKFSLPLEKLPASIEGGVPIVEALHTGERVEFGAVNMPNSDRQIPNLPEDAIVETPAVADGGKLAPVAMPDVPAPLVEHMLLQHEIQSLIAEAVINRDPAPAFEAFCMDPLAPPTRDACRRAFDELHALQNKSLPF